MVSHGGHKGLPTRKILRIWRYRPDTQLDTGWVNTYTMSIYLYVLENIYVWFFLNNNRIVIWYILIRVIRMCVCVTHCVTSDSLNGQSSQPTRTFLPRERTLVAGAPFWKNYQQLEELSHFFPWIHGFTPRSPVVKKSEGTKLAKTSSCFTDPSSATIGKWNCQKRAATRHNTSETPKDLRLPHLKP